MRIDAIDGTIDAFRLYRAAIRERAGRIQFVGLPTLQDVNDVSIESLFVPPKLSTKYIDASTQPDRWAERFDVVDLIGQERRLVVLGDPGGGKSTLINWVSWRLCAGFTEPLKYDLHLCLPIPIILRELELDGIGSFDDLLGRLEATRVGQQLSRNRELVNELLANGKALILVDGFDEISLAKRQLVRATLVDLVLRYPQALLVCTSRIVGYEDCELHNLLSPYTTMSASSASKADVEDLRKQIGRTAGAIRTRTRQLRFSTDKAGGRVVYVAPFDDRQIYMFAENWYRLRSLPTQEARDNTANFVSAIQKSPATEALARTPNFLTLMALVFRVRSTLPDGRALLYDDISQAYLETIDQARGLRGKEDVYSWREKKRWLARVAFEMQVERARKSSEPLESASHQLASENAVKGWLCSAILESDRIGNVSTEEFVSSYLEWLSARSGLLIPRGKFNEEEHYAFAHLSFQEYFAASYVLEQVRSPEWYLSQVASSVPVENDAFDKRVSARSLQRWTRDPRWQEALVFMFELLENESKWATRLFNLTVLPPNQVIDTVTSAAHRNGVVLAARLATNSATGISDELRSKTFETAAQLVVSGFTRFDESSEPYLSDPNAGLGRILFGNLKSCDVLWEQLALRVNDQLNLSDCGLSDIRPLATPSFRRLRKIDLSQNQCKGWNQLGSLTKLEQLRIRAVAIGSLEWILALRGLQSLNMAASVVSDLAPLGKLPSLRFLDIQRTRSETWTSLERLNKLEELRCDWIPEILGWVDSLPLKALRINGATRRSVSGGYGTDGGRADLGQIGRVIEHLEELHLDDFTTLKNWPYLWKANELKKLSLEVDPDEDYSEIDALSSLEELLIWSGDSKALSRYPMMRALVRLDVFNGDLDASIVKEKWPALERIGIYGGSIVNSEALIEQENLVLVQMYGAGIDEDIKNELEDAGISVEVDFDTDEIASSEEATLVDNYDDSFGEN